MSDQPQPEPIEPETAADHDEPLVVLDGEVVEVLPAVTEVRAIERVANRPAVQVAAAAATGFVAGAATLALARLGSRARSRALEDRLTQALRPSGLPGVGPTRTYIVRVRTIERHDGP